MSAYGDALRASLAAIECRENARWDGEQFIPWEEAMTADRTAAGAERLTQCLHPYCKTMMPRPCGNGCPWIADRTAALEAAHRTYGDGLTLAQIEASIRRVIGKRTAIDLAILDLIATAKEADRMREALKAVRVYVQDCIENGHDRTMLGNMYGARDEIDAAGVTG